MNSSHPDSVLPDKRLFWIFALSSAVYFTQGIEALPSQGLFYYLKETLGFSVEKIMLLSSVIMLAWVVKPLIGYVIDNFLNKKVWIFIALALDITVSLFVGLIPMPIFVLIAFLLINSTNAAFRDVAVDGIMCVEGKRHNATGRIQSIQWISISIAGLITGLGGGFIAQRWGYQAAFLCLVPVYLLVGFLAFHYNGGGMQSGKPRSALRADMKRLFSDRRILVVALFIFLYKFSPSFGPPLVFIQRDAFKWSKIWIGALGTISTVFGVIGSILYYRFSVKIKMKKW